MSLTKVAELMDELDACRGRILVLKIGGNSIAEDPTFLPSIAQQIELFASLRTPVIIVHGGGPQIDRALTAAGLAVAKAPDGRRPTSPAAMQIVARTMADISRAVANELSHLGCRVFNAAEADTFFLSVDPLYRDMTPEQDRTGTPRSIDAQTLYARLAEGRVIVTHCMGQSEDGLAYNVNGDDAAMAYAVAMKARRLILATNVPGVYGADKVPISHMTTAEARQMMTTGVIGGGMVPKIEGAVQAVEQGVSGVAIINGHARWAILGELLTREGCGTLITRD